MAIKKSDYSPVTIHDAKGLLIEFFEDESYYRDNKQYLAKLKNDKKALMAFNRAVRSKRKEFENNILAGKNVKDSDDYIRLRKKIVLDIKPWIRETLQNEYYMFKYNDFFLKEIDYFRLNNKINYYSGKSFYFIIDCSFKKYKATESKIKKMTKLSEENFALFLLEKYEEGFNEQNKLDKSTLTKEQFKKRQKMYGKLDMVIAHNKAIASDEGYDNELYELDKSGNFIKKEGRYPMMFELRDEVMEIYIP